MAITTKDEQSEAVRQQHRNAAGAWINGSELKEQSKATDRKSTRLNSSHSQQSRMPSSA